MIPVTGGEPSEAAAPVTLWVMGAYTVLKHMRREAVPMPSWLTGRNLAMAAGCAGAIAVVLFPASLVTLGLGAVLGYKGREWLDTPQPDPTSPNPTRQ